MYHVKFSFSFQNCIQIFCITFPLLFIFISNCVLVVTIFFHFTFYYVHFTFCIIFMYHSKKLVRLFISHFLVTFIVLSVFFFSFPFHFLFFRPLHRRLLPLPLPPLPPQSTSRAANSRSKAVARVGRSGRWWRRRKAPPWIQTAG